MSTNARIALHTTDGYRSVFLNWDGYLSHAGRILLEHFDTPKTLRLVEEGNLSAIGAEIGEQHDGKSFPRPKDSCTFYLRDRAGDDDEPNDEVCELAIPHEDFQSMVQATLDDCGSGCYLYVRANDNWFYCDRDALERMQRHYEGPEVELLTEEVTRLPLTVVPEVLSDVPPTPEVEAQPESEVLPEPESDLPESTALTQNPPAPPADPNGPTMSFQVGRKALLAAINRVLPAVPTREVKPILKHLRVTANGKATLEATDLEIGIRLDLAVEATQVEGAALFEAKTLKRTIYNSKERDVILSGNATTCTVRGVSLSASIPGDNEADYPQVPAWEAKAYHEIGALVFRDMIRQVIFAAAEGESARFAMTGVLLELDGLEVKLVATDGRRLALAEGKASYKGKHTTRGMAPLVPVKTMKLLEKNLAVGGTVKVAVKKDEAIFQTEDAVIYSRLVDGRFPDYRQVFPKQSGVKAKLKVAEFLEAMQGAGGACTPEEIRATLVFADNKLVITVKNQAGQFEKEMACEFSDAPLTINFNPFYLIDCLKVQPKNGEVELEMAPVAKNAKFSAAPAMLRGVEGVVHLLMPLS